MRSPRSHPRIGPTQARHANAPAHRHLSELLHTTHRRSISAISTYHTAWYTISRHKKARAVHQQQKRGLPPWGGASRLDMRKRRVLLNTRARTYSTSGPFLYNLYTIQKLKSKKNPRSIQNATLWVGLTSSNDMLHSQQQRTRTLDSRAVLLQTNDIWTLI